MDKLSKIYNLIINLKQNFMIFFQIIYQCQRLLLQHESLKVDLILANSADPDEMQHNAAFHLGLLCLPTYPFRAFEYKKGISLVIAITKL